jgi:uncharacterized membrane protein
MTLLIIACAAFVILHLGVSSTSLRGIFLEALGENSYLGLYSLVAIVSLGTMIYAYAGITHTDYFWHPHPVAYTVTKVLVLLAIVLLVMGTMTKNPTAVKMEGAINQEVRGILKITRHPTQWAILLYSIGHIIANGDLASIILFGTLALVSSMGMVAIDVRKKANFDEEWLAFYATTSLVPFVALISGKTRLALAEINWLAVAVGLVLYVCVYWLHDMVSGGASLF